MDAHPPRITALVADDEEGPREQLLGALRAVWPTLDIVAVATNGADAWDAWLEHEPQVAFLDIRMPGLSGIDVAQRIGGRSRVVFVTAHGDHALAAFDAGAVDYVLKPVDRERLGRAAARVQDGLAQSAPSAARSEASTAATTGAVAAPAAPGLSAPDLQRLLQTLADQQRRPPPLEVIQASVGREVKLIRVQDVLYFESDARYTRVVWRDADDGRDGDALIRTPLKELLTQLDARRFWQIHRSVVVAQARIASAVRGDDGSGHMWVTLRGRPEKLPVSRHFQGLFKGL